MTKPVQSAFDWQVVQQSPSLSCCVVSRSEPVPLSSVLVSGPVKMYILEVRRRQCHRVESTVLGCWRLSDRRGHIKTSIKMKSACGVPNKCVVCYTERPEKENMKKSMLLRYSKKQKEELSRVECEEKLVNAKSLGRGKGGEVFEMSSSKVLKVVNMQTDDDEDYEIAVKEFENEVLALKELRETNVVVYLYDAWINNERGYILSEKLYPCKVTQQTVKDLLKVVHSFRWYHRDMTPSNVMCDRLGTAKIIDFGQARKLSADEKFRPETDFIYLNQFAT